jgi:hypothetical protein
MGASCNYDAHVRFRNHAMNEIYLDNSIEKRSLERSCARAWSRGEDVYSSNLKLCIDLTERL